MVTVGFKVLGLELQLDAQDRTGSSKNIHGNLTWLQDQKRNSAQTCENRCEPVTFGGVRLLGCAADRVVRKHRLPGGATQDFGNYQNG